MRKGKLFFRVLVSALCLILTVAFAACNGSADHIPKQESGEEPIDETVESSENTNETANDTDEVDPEKGGIWSDVHLPD